VASLAYGNAGDGIIITVSDIAIGGSGPSDGNIIAGNARHGITIKSSNVNGRKCWAIPSACIRCWPAT
jgi:hypothetical protein